MVRKRDISGKTFGNLLALRIDEERHAVDKAKKKAGEISRVRIYYICKCLLCGKILSVRGENLVSGNTKGCGCDSNIRTGEHRHDAHLNEYRFDTVASCYVGVANNTGAEFMFDICDYDSVSQLCWHENSSGYMAARSTDGKIVLLHRMILSHLLIDSDTHCVDHINRNRLDCRRTNLRACTPIQNAHNRTVRSDSKSGYRGVRFDSNANKWQSYIYINNEVKSLGYFSDIESAICARRDAESKLYGSYAPL